ncbi:MAG: TfoX/Sxy family protein [Alphaproteobacteria bacterium]
MSPKAGGPAGRTPRRGNPPVVDRLIARLTPLGDVKARAMFGGHGFYLDGVFFAIAAGERIFFKVDGQTRARYEGAGMAAFRPFDDHMVLRSYYEVPAAVLADGEALLAWAAESQAAARRVGAAKAGRRRR